MKRWFGHHWELVGYLFLTFGIVIGFYFLNQSRVALCALRTDLDARVVSQRQSVQRGVIFLRKHPRGAFGFSKRDIQVSISAQRRSLENSSRSRDSLDALWCGRDTK